MTGATPHVIICGSESEISIALKQRLAVSALLTKTDTITSAGMLPEHMEGELREISAAVRAAFKFDCRQ
jgi:hypothetical protein